MLGRVEPHTDTCSASERLLLQPIKAAVTLFQLLYEAVSLRLAACLYGTFSCFASLAA